MKLQKRWLSKGTRDLYLPWSTVRNILKSILKWYPYNWNSFVEQLNTANLEKRLNFRTIFLARIIVDNKWPQNILWFGEAHFTLDGVVNSLNCCICGSARSHFVYEHSLQLDYITVWCSFTIDFNLCPFFSEKNPFQGPQRFSITGLRFCNLLQEYVIFALCQRQSLETTLFMDDGAPPHNSRELTSLLRAHFGNEFVISRGFSTAWPPRSPNVSPSNFWLWEFLKNHMSRGNIRTAPGLKKA